MIRTLYRSSQGEMSRELTDQQIRDALRDASGTLWMDIVPGREAPEQIAATLRELFKFHPLALDDALHQSHVPRVDDWGTYLYIVLQAVDLEVNRTLDVHELDVFLGANYLVTIHHEPIRALDHVWEGCCRGQEQRLAGGADHLLYALLDAVVADIMPVVDGLDEEIDDLENEIFDRPRRQAVSRIFRLRRTLLQLRRLLGSLRELLNKLARDEFAVIDAADRIYFRDVYDHLVRLYDIADGLRDMIVGALDSYVSVTSNRLNEIMRTLTVVTVVFAPISFITGFFGMNFFGESFNIQNPTAAWFLFVVCLLAIAGTPLSMVWWMRRRGWLKSIARGDPMKSSGRGEDDGDRPASRG